MFLSILPCWVSACFDRSVEVVICILLGKKTCKTRLEYFSAYSAFVALHCCSALLLSHYRKVPVCLVSGITVRIRVDLSFCKASKCKQNLVTFHFPWLLSKLFLKQLSLKNTSTAVNCLFIQFVKGFEWILWEHSMEVSWKKSHSTKKDEAPVHIVQPSYLYFVMLGETASSETPDKKGSRIDSQREVTTGIIHRIQRLPGLERW